MLLQERLIFLLRTEYSVTRISESRTDICILIQTSVKISYIYFNIGMSLGQSFQTFRCCNYTHKLYMLSAALLNEINRFNSRSAGSKHRIEKNYKSLLDRISDILEALRQQV